MLDLVASPVLRSPTPADGELVVPEHIHDPRGGKGDSEEVRPLRHDRADQEASVGGARDSDVLGRGVPLFDQELRGGDEVFEALRFVQEHPSPVPPLSVLGTAPDAGYGVDSACVGNDEVGGVEERGRGDGEASVSGEVDGPFPVLGKTPPVDQEEGDLSPILALVEELLGFVLGGVEGCAGGEEGGGTACGRVVEVLYGGVGVGGEVVEELSVLPLPGETDRRSGDGEGDLPDLLSLGGELVEPAHSVPKVTDEEAGSGHGGLGDHFGPFGDDLLPVPLIRSQRVDGDDVEVRGPGVGENEKASLPVG